MLSHRDSLSDAIRDRWIVRLGYARQADEVISLHFVAPVDIRAGDSARTSNTLYLWAYCFDEGRVEMHLLDRVRSVQVTDRRFDPSDVLGQWPVEKWPLPASWVVERKW